MSKPSIEQVAAIAWNWSKAGDDPPFHLCTQDHREKLIYHAQNVAKGGAATTPFDKAVWDVLTNPAKVAAELAPKPEPKPIEIAPETTVIAVSPDIAPPEPAKPTKTKKGK